MITLTLLLAVFSGLCFYAGSNPRNEPVSGDAADMLGWVSALFATVLLLITLSSCEWYDVATSSAMRQELRNGAIVRAEMRARGEMPWSNWP